MMNNTFAIINGNLTPIKDAQIPLTDRGLLFGQAVFETFLFTNGKIIGFEEHYTRLLNGCNETLIPTISKEAISKLLEKVIHANTNCENILEKRFRVRVTVTGGTGLTLWESDLSQKKPNVYIFLEEIPSITKSVLLKGLKVFSVQDTRGAVAASIKGTNYTVALKAIKEAKERGYDDAIYYNSSNNLTELTTASFVWFKDSSIYTTPLSEGCLQGTTIEIFKRALLKNNKTLHYSPLNKNNLESIDFACLISSTRGLIPLAIINETEYNIAKYIEYILWLNLILNEEQLLLQ